jgi:hypothetical protein
MLRGGAYQACIVSLKTQLKIISLADVDPATTIDQNVGEEVH